MKSVLISLGLLLLFPLSVSSQDVEAIIKRVEDNLNGKTARMTLSMTVTTKRATRTMEMESFSEGNTKSFIRILYPGKDKGITFLKIDNAMWQYIPRIEKIIKIPASMMLQSWMGSDFTNDDLVKESSMTKDYTPTLVEQTDDVYRVELMPREDAPVVWGKIVMDIGAELYLPRIMIYFAEDGEQVRTIEYLDVQIFGNRAYPTRWVVTPISPTKKGHQKDIKVQEAVFDAPIDANRFSKRALKRYSR
ncbi:MAG: outer membrane lipoprotein-sorting protein [Spirochaetales bacterium]|jgi:outer membrane lipoprotein-sorting protein|nr:outer membrane lipoprotein-sorting protein [Spirochaetales bacterium]